MEQNTTLSQSIDITEQKAKYDVACKKVLAEKIILAWIMKHTMKEYAAYDVQEIVEKYIVGEPQVAEKKVMPDETNMPKHAEESVVSLAMTTPKIAGVGVEDSSLTEGTVTYDIQFRAIVPAIDEVVQMIINVEAQNNFYPGYPIIKRGIYYCARMISSQYGTVFTKSHYEKIQKVYSVWICMNPPVERNNTITEYSLTEKNYVGNVKEKKEYYDLINAVMVCLGTSEGNAENELLRLLDVLLVSDKKAEEKKAILESEFNIPMTEKMEEEVKHMCNLSDGVEQRGIQKGIQQGIQLTLCELVRDNLLSLEEAAKRAGVSIEEFQRLCEEVIES